MPWVTKTTKKPNMTWKGSSKFKKHWHLAFQKKEKKPAYGVHSGNLRQCCCYIFAWISRNALFCREIVDSKCYSLTYEFVCQLLQPVCFHEKMILPCQDFCTEFMNSCANVLPGDLRDRIKCSVLATEADGPGSCISKPGTERGRSILAWSWATWCQSSLIVNHFHEKKPTFTFLM